MRGLLLVDQSEHPVVPGASGRAQRFAGSQKP